MSNISSRVEEFKRFLERGIWELDLSKEPNYKRRFYGILKVLMLGIIGIKDDNVMLRASALTYFTLLSIVPVLALAFGLAKGFGMDKVLEQQIIENFQGQEEVFRQSLDFAKNLLESTQGGLVAGVGLIFLFYSVMKLLNHIETAFNGIWYVTKERNLTRKLTDYITIMLLGPILLILANSLTIFIFTEVARFTESLEFISFFRGFILWIVGLLPYTVIWLLFSLIYIILPNTTVKLRSAIVAGIIAGSLFQLLEVFLFRFGVNVSEYNAIYGSFAALPLFLLWLQLSWIIVLFGSEISYAVQNVNSYEGNIKGEGFSHKFKKKIAIAVTMIIVNNFKEGKEALSLEDINTQIKIPSKLLQTTLDILKQCGILSEMKSKAEMHTYQPAIDTDLISIGFIIDRYEAYGVDKESNINKQGFLKIADEVVDQIDEIINKSDVNKVVKTM